MVNKEKKNESAAQKKPYVKPVCVSEGVFETTALACGKIPGQGGACAGHPRAS